jgi:transposase InsO family protein
MKVHANAALGPAGRLALVSMIERGTTIRAAARAVGVSPATAHRWWHRYRVASPEERRSGSWLCDRPSCPRRQPRRLTAAEEEPILRARRETNLGPGRLAGIVDRARSTIWKVLYRHGLSRLRGEPGPATKGYEWSRAGALIHVDTAQLPAFASPGHRILGMSPEVKRRQRESQLGHVYLHVAVDDRSRYAYVEQHRDQRGETAARFLRRALEHFSGLGLAPPEAVMSDRAMAYRNSRAFKTEVARVGARHILTPPYTPRWNGKVERFIQTLKREWGFAHSWPSSAQRARALRSFVRYYNRRRPHSSLGDRPPISRVHNVRGRDS